MSKYIPIPCRGCLSFGHWCRRYTATSNKQHRRFREKYCPCITCLVKPTCRDPKVIRFVHNIYDRPHHKCRILYEALTEFEFHGRKLDEKIS